MLPLIRALSAERVDVICHSTAKFENTLRSARGIVRLYESDTLRTLDHFSREPASSSLLLRLLAQANHEVVESQIGRMRKEVDGVIHDALAPWGRNLRRLEKLPAVAFSSMLVPNPAVLRIAMRSGFRHNDLWAGAGHALATTKLNLQFRLRYGTGRLAAHSILFADEALNVIATSRALQPGDESLDTSWIFAPPPYDEEDSIEFPWNELEDREVIVATAGTVFNSDDAYYEMCAEALSGLGAKVVMTRGGGEWTGGAPRYPDIMARTMVPLRPLFRRSGLFVTHGGMGATAMALQEGVPLVVVPQIIEQAVVGRRVEQLGAGRVVLRHKLTVKALREAAMTVLGDPSFAVAARRLGETLTVPGAMDAAARAVIEHVVRERES
jgi:MGT family glycosyltransferase